MMMRKNAGGIAGALANIAIGALCCLSLSAQGADSPDCSPFSTPPVFMGKVPSPRTVLGFPIGSQALTTEQSDRYLAAADAASPRVISGSAATSVQGRPLRYAIVGHEANLTQAGLDRLRKSTRQLIDPDTAPAAAESLAAATPAIFWVTGNVHGNEKSGADAAIQLVHELADRSDCVVSRILDKAVVVVLPIQNPDGREANTRRNAYGFDMNRDWFARTQPETDGKLELLRQYPPTLYIDAHEFSAKDYFFPPNADPVYHEVPERAFDWINNLYATAIAAEMDRQRIRFFHGAPYDLYAVEYGDSVPTVGFHAAGMTFEKHSGDRIDERVHEHFVAMLTSLFAGAGDKARILREWQLSRAEAKAQGAAGTLEENAIHLDGKALYQPVPADASVRHYFFLDEPDRARELARLIRRLQRMDVAVWRLQAPLQVPDFHPYGGKTGAATLPAGSYWVPMAQGQKHWIQAMLHEDPYIPVSVSYDVTAWSNPLLMNVAGGWSGTAAEQLAPRAALVPPVDEPPPPGPPPGAKRIGLFEMPGSTTSFVSAGAIRYLFKHIWGIPYVEVDAQQISDGRLQGLVDVLLVPDGYAPAALQALGTQGKKALAAWVEGGGRYVGYLGGTELAAKAGISTAVLQASHTSAPGTLIRIKLDPASPLAAGIAPTPDSTPTAWVMYFDDDRMAPGLGKAAATFPVPGDPSFHTSGLAIGVEELGGTAAAVDERVGNGRAVVFSFDPNFRAWPDGTQRILWNALYGPDPAAVPAVSSKVRASAAERADTAAKSLPGLGKAIRLVVRPDDADLARSLLQRHGAEFKELQRSERTIFLIENRAGLSWEDHPFILDFARDLRTMITPISFSVP